MAKDNLAVGAFQMLVEPDAGRGSPPEPSEFRSARARRPPCDHSLGFWYKLPKEDLLSLTIVTKANMAQWEAPCTY